MIFDFLLYNKYLENLKMKQSTNTLIVISKHLNDKDYLRQIKTFNKANSIVSIDISKDNLFFLTGQRNMKVKLWSTL